jgi:hypothetical protein
MATLPGVGQAADFSALEFLDGYLPVEDHGVIGDCTTAALIGRNGTISWLCIPNLDSDPVFCALPDRDQEGGFRVDAGRLKAARSARRRSCRVPVWIASAIIRGTTSCPMCMRRFASGSSAEPSRQGLVRVSLKGEKRRGRGPLISARCRP